MKCVNQHDNTSVNNRSEYNADAGWEYVLAASNFRELKNDRRRGKMTRTVVGVEGMMCGMCEAHICDAIRKAVPSAKKVTASRSKKEAVFLSDEPVSEEIIKNAIDATGYSCLSVRSEPYEKRGLFGRR